MVVMVLGCIQRKLLYFPDSTDPELPAGPAYTGLEDVVIEAADGVQLRAWYWPAVDSIGAAENAGATIVIFHGNAGNRFHRLDWMRSLHQRGFGVFVLDYRGYGGSAGSPTEDGLYTDGDAVVGWLGERGVEPLVFLGESLGGGVAVEMAARHSPAALVVQSSFSSAVDVGRRAYPFLPVSLILIDRFESVEKIASVECPVLIIHGEDDRMISIDLGRKLFDAATEPKEWYAVPGAGHNDLVWRGGEAYFARLSSFLGECLKSARAPSSDPDG